MLIENLQKRCVNEMPNNNKTKKNTTPKNKRLGKGLDAIFGGDITTLIDDIENNTPLSKQVLVPLDEIRPNPYQPRKLFDEEKLQELASSIKEHGVFQPVILKSSIQGYEIVAGERRCRAARMAGLSNIPAIIVEFTDQQMMEIALLENIQREDLNAIEEARAYQQLMERLDLTQEELGKRIGKSRSYIANTLRLLQLPEKIQNYVLEGKLTMGHARCLITLEKAMVKFDIGNSLLYGKEVFNCKIAYGAAVKFNDFLMCPLSALGTACLSYSGQNYGAKDVKRLKLGLKQALILMFIIYLILVIIGVACSINGNYTELFLSSDNNNDRVRFYASTYMIIDSCMYFSLGLLFIGRNYLQGLGKSLYPFLAGICELVGRVVIAEFMPSLVDKANPYSDRAYISVCFSDSLAWIFAFLVLMIGIYIYIIKGKSFKELEDLSKRNVQLKNQN